MIHSIHSTNKFSEKYAEKDTECASSTNYRAFGTISIIKYIRGYSTLSGNIFVLLGRT
jgi:hypothetical protein